MTLSEGSMMSTETVSRYLQDVARMLGDVDPAYRAEVLAGVHDHLEAALGPVPWREADVRQALDQLGPPEEIAVAALDDGQRQVEVRPAFTARSWVPPVAVTTMAIGLLGTLFLFSNSYGFYPGVNGQEFVSLPEPFSFLRGFLWLLLVPTTWLVIVGALLVTISPLYGTVDRLASWLAVPWTAAVFKLATFTLRATDDCARSSSGSCTGVDSQTARVAMVAALTIAAIGAVLLLIRLSRGRTMSRSGATRWWTATAVALGLLISALPIVLLPLTYREGAYVSHGVEGPVAYPWTFGATLVPVLVIVPVWLLTLVLLIRSPLWTRTTKVIGVALLPALLAAASAVTVAPTSVSPTVLTAGTAVTIAGAAAVALAAEAAPDV